MPHNQSKAQIGPSKGRHSKSTTRRHTLVTSRVLKTARAQSCPDLLKPVVRRTLNCSEGEQRTLAIMPGRRDEGCSLQGIADYLNRLGMPARGGSPWRFQYVRSIFRRSVAA